MQFADCWHRTTQIWRKCKIAFDCYRNQSTTVLPHKYLLFRRLLCLFIVFHHNFYRFFKFTLIYCIDNFIEKQFSLPKPQLSIIWRLSTKRRASSGHFSSFFHCRRYHSSTAKNTIKIIIDREPCVAILYAETIIKLR